MNTADTRILQTALTSAAIGGFTSLAVLAAVLALDILSIATLIGASAEPGLVSAVLIGGAMTKGLAFGAVFGIAFAASRSSALIALPVKSLRALIS